MDSPAVAEERGRPLVVFDGDCAFCTTSARWLAARLRRSDGADARLIPWQFADLVALGTTVGRAQQEVLWIGADGGLHGGAEAIAAWLRHRGGAYGLVGRVMGWPLVRTLAAATYRLVAANRQRMPGGSPACALPPPGYDPAQPGTQAL